MRLARDLPRYRRGSSPKCHLERKSAAAAARGASLRSAAGTTGAARQGVAQTTSRPRAPPVLRARDPPPVPPGQLANVSLRPKVARGHRPRCEPATRRRYHRGSSPRCRPGAKLTRPSARLAPPALRSCDMHRYRRGSSPKCRLERKSAAATARGASLRSAAGTTGAARQGVAQTASRPRAPPVYPRSAAGATGAARQRVA